MRFQFKALSICYAALWRVCVCFECGVGEHGTHTMPRMAELHNVRCFPSDPNATHSQYSQPARRRRRSKRRDIYINRFIEPFSTCVVMVCFLYLGLDCFSVTFMSPVRVARHASSAFGLKHDKNVTKMRSPQNEKCVFTHQKQVVAA